MHTYIHTEREGGEREGGERERQTHRETERETEGFP